MWITLVLVGIISYFIYYFLLKPSPQYWKKYGIYQVSDIGSVMDHFKILIGKDGMTLADLDERAYHQAPESEKVVGVFENAEYGTPILLTKDLEMVKAVMIKDFEYFVDRRGFPDPDPHSTLNFALFNLTGDQWKGVRASVSPTFTTGKIRRMNKIVNKICVDWVNHFNESIKRDGGNSTTFTVIKETTNYTVDAIAASIFGMEANAISNPNSGFGYHAQKLTENSAANILKFAFTTIFPKISRILKIQIFPKETVAFFVDSISHGLKQRMDGKVKANDFLQILAEARKGELKAVGSDELSEFEKDAEIKDSSGKKNWLDSDHIVHAQIFQFFIAGFSTTSNVIGFVFYCLALNRHVQDKLREEVDKKLFPNGDETEIDYDELNKLAYLDMVESEVLRKFPVLNRHERICSREYYNDEFKIRIPKGTVVGIPVQAIHNDLKYYERPHSFYPEHFSPEKKAERSPYAYLPFGHGPRNCIGMRFALVNSKAAIAHIIHNFKIEPATDTPRTLKAQGGRVGVAMLDDLKLKFVPIRR